jgi:hypothetical protein
MIFFFLLVILWTKTKIRLIEKRKKKNNNQRNIFYIFVYLSEIFTNVIYGEKMIIVKNKISSIINSHEIIIIHIFINVHLGLFIPNDSIFSF